MSVSDYRGIVRDLEVDLFEVLGLGAVLDEGGFGDLDRGNNAREYATLRPGEETSASTVGRYSPKVGATRVCGCCPNPSHCTGIG